MFSYINKKFVILFLYIRVILGQASKSGLTAYENIESGELLIKMTRECAICPSEILDYFPFINYLREIWKKFHGTDHDDILTLVSYLLLTDR